MTSTQLEAAVPQTALDPSPQPQKVEDHGTPATPQTDVKNPRVMKRGIAVRIVTIIALLFTAWHIFASFLWIAPVTPLRELVPGNTLSSYMLPMFGQSWSVFAPAPINGDFSLKVRAMLVSSDGQPSETEWVDAAQVEVDGMHTHNLFPPRSSTAGLQQASALKSAWEDLSSEQQKTASLGFFKGDDWSERLSFQLGQGTDGAAAQKYAAADLQTTAYATQVARAVWGADVQQVQFQVSRRNVVPFAQRNNPDADRPARQVVSTGWRGTLDMPGQSDTRVCCTFG